jgi:hypothetical protein
VFSGSLNFFSFESCQDSLANLRSVGILGEEVRGGLFSSPTSLQNQLVQKLMITVESEHNEENINLGYLAEILCRLLKATR